MKYIYFLIPIVLIFSGCQTTASALQRRTFEAKELEGKFDDAFKSTLQVLQDYGYIIKSSEYDSGVIQGETGIERSFWGTMSHYEITATLEQFGDNIVKERISLVLYTKTSSQYGTQEGSKIVDDPETFQKIYNSIQKEMFIRANLNK